MTTGTAGLDPDATLLTDEVWTTLTETDEALLAGADGTLLEVTGLTAGGGTPLAETDAGLLWGAGVAVTVTMEVM